MAYNAYNDGHSSGSSEEQTDWLASNGFGRCTLHVDEAWALHRVGYMVSPDMRCPEHWRLSAGGHPLSSFPVSDNDREEAIYNHFWYGLTDAERADPAWHPENHEAWNIFFHEQREAQLAAYDGNGPPPRRNNRVGRRCWWGVPRRSLAAVLEHIRNGNQPGLEMPPPMPRRPARRWLPRRTGSSSSSGSRSSGSSAPRTPAASPPSRYAPTLAPVKDEYEEKPSLLRKRSGCSGRGGIVIGGRRAAPEPSPPTSQLRLVKPKKEVKREWTPPPDYKVKALELKAANEPDEEFPGMAEILRWSYNDVPLMSALGIPSLRW